jgi:hypothetical protein
MREKSDRVKALLVCSAEFPPFSPNGSAPVFIEHFFRAALFSEVSRGAFLFP